VTEISGTELIHWRELDPADRRSWWEDRWLDAIALTARYRLSLRNRWWEDSIQVEALAAFAAWVALYDSGTYTDPPGKLQLLWEIERLRAVLRGGEEAFHPARDRAAYERHLASIGADGDPDQDEQNDLNEAARHRQRALQAEAANVAERIVELEQRARLLTIDVQRPRPNDRDATQARRDLDEITRTLEQLRRRQRELRAELDGTSDGL
jgi:hypothetical protein